MPIHVEARGWARAGGEFLYLGLPPTDTWWTAYDTWWSDQNPAILVRSNDSGWSAYVQGIESTRRDASRRRPPYVVVFEGSHDTSGENIEAVLLMRLLASWLPTYRKGDPNGPVSAVLDEVLTAEHVEQLRTSPGELTARVVEELIRKALLDGRITAWDEPEAASTPDGAWGSFTDKKAQEAFVGRVQELVSGRRLGAAFWLNQLTTEDQAADVVAQAGGNALVLALEPAEPLTGVVAVPGKKPQGPVQTGPQRINTAAPCPEPGLQLLRVAALLVGIVLVIGIIIWAISRETKT